jgi:FHA domain-containing protein
MIWVEILSWQRDVAARFRCAGPEIRIGRGYDNDVVVDDPYVAAHHMRIFRDETGALVAEDVGSVNGMFLQGDKNRHHRIVVDGKRPIRIGHTALRIRETSHPVAAERVTGTPGGTRVIALAGGLSIVLVMMGLLDLWMSQTTEPRALTYLAPLLAPLTVAAWAAIWSLLSRIVSGNARFARNFVIALCGVLAFSVGSHIAQFSAFALTWRVPLDYQYVVMWCVLAGICFFHLREVSASRLLLKAAIVASVCALGITAQAIQQSEALYLSGRQDSSRPLLPPALRLAPVRDETTFFAAIEDLKARLDSDRSKSRAEDARR